VIVQPSVESIQAFKVLTGSFSAEFGRGAGIVTTQTKSGSDRLHGSAFEFLRNSYMDARNNCYYYAQRQLKGQTYRNSVPTALERSGNFTDYKNSSGGLIPIYDPTTTQLLTARLRAGSLPATSFRPI